MKHSITLRFSKVKWLALTGALAACLPSVARSQIFLNEILANNQSIAPLTNFPNYFPDYVELYNTSTSNINLAAGQ